jgi:hypothetical protein
MTIGAADDFFRLSCDIVRWPIRDRKVGSMNSAMLNFVANPSDNTKRFHAACKE